MISTICFCLSQRSCGTHLGSSQGPSVRAGDKRECQRLPVSSGAGGRRHSAPCHSHHSSGRDDLTGASIPENAAAAEASHIAPSVRSGGLWTAGAAAHQCQLRASHCRLGHPLPTHGLCRCRAQAPGSAPHLRPPRFESSFRRCTSW